MKPNEDRETSEFQDTQRTFQRIDEASSEAFNVWLSVAAGDFSRMNEFIDKTDVYFGIFRHICLQKDQKPIDELREKLKGRINIELRKVGHMQVYCPHLPIQITEGLKEDLRNYKLKIDKLREEYKLASRTKKKPDWKKRVDNATRY